MVERVSQGCMWMSDTYKLVPLATQTKGGERRTTKGEKKGEGVKDVRRQMIKKMKKLKERKKEGRGRMCVRRRW